MELLSILTSVLYMQSMSMLQEIVQVLYKTEIVDPCMPDGMDTMLYKVHYFHLCFDLHQAFI
eukprot:15356387-Ditylum_brightwellii.AAC.1